MKIYWRIFAIGFYLVLTWGCRNEIGIPKPHGYPRITYPPVNYRMVDQPYCPLRFEFPTYGEVFQDTAFFDEKPSHPCWFTVQVPSLNASLHCSYGPLKDKADLDHYIEDEYKLLAKHNIKADYRDETVLKNKHGVSGMGFEIQGPVASPYQFYFTDSLHHFFRASLYFNAQVNADSTKPVLEFLLKDLRHMQETFEWKN